MLKLFINIDNDNIISMNDAYFDRYTFANLQYYVAQDVIRRIDGVELTQDFKIVSKFTQGLLSLDHLSTGCKTVLNIIFNQDKIFTLAECGKNALEVLYEYSTGNAYTPILITPIRKDIACDVQAFSEFGEQRFIKTSDLRDWYNEVSANED